MALMKREDYLPNWSNYLSDFFNRDWHDWANKNYSLTNTTLPSANIKDANDHFEVEMAVPGMTRDDIKIELEKDVLTISSEKQAENEEKEKGYTRREFSYQSFSRAFTLPNIVDDDKIEATYTDGILKVLIPKKEEALPKPPKRISIS